MGWKETTLLSYICIRFDLKNQESLFCVLIFWDIPKAWPIYSRPGYVNSFFVVCFEKSQTANNGKRTSQSQKKSNRHQTHFNFCLSSSLNIHYLILEKEGRIKARMGVFHLPAVASLLRLPMDRNQSRISKLKTAIWMWLFHPKKHHSRDQQILLHPRAIILRLLSLIRITSPAAVLARKSHSLLGYLINSTQLMRMPSRPSKAHTLRQKGSIVAIFLFPGWTLQNAWTDGIAPKSYYCLLATIYVKP